MLMPHNIFGQQEGCLEERKESYTYLIRLVSVSLFLGRWRGLRSPTAEKRRFRLAGLRHGGVHNQPEDQCSSHLLTSHF